MTTTLSNPDQPAGFIISENKDGTYTRNDGERLQPADKNIYYLLATVFGEHEEGQGPWNFDQEIVKQNRRYWNGWMCQNLSNSERREWAKKLNLSVDELEPLTAAEQKKVRARLAILGKSTKAPKPEDIINMQNT